MPRSQFIDDLESLFEDLTEGTITDELTEIERIGTESELADLLCTRLGRDAPAPGGTDKNRLSKLLEDILPDEKLAKLASIVRTALDYDNVAQLGENVVQKYFARRIRSSATRLSTFAACPYRHFARYMLRLNKREEFKFEPLDLGSFYHHILDALTKRLTSEGKDFAAIEDDELVGLLREEIEQFIQGNSFISNFISRRGYNDFIIRSAADILEDCTLAIAQMLLAGSFRPKLSEVSFGRVSDAGKTLGECEFTLPDGRVLSLDGKIDRLDVSDDAAIVFDYKRKDTSFAWSKFYHGLDMQLPIYMLAVRKSSGEPAKNIAGAFFMPIEVSPERTTIDKLPGISDAFERKARGIFNGEFFRELDRETKSGWSRFYSFRITSKDAQYGDYKRSGVLKPKDFEALLQFSEIRIVRLATEISSGNIVVMPYRLNQASPCSYCDFKSVCRFDWQVNDYNSLEALSKAEVIEMLEGNDG